MSLRIASGRFKGHVLHGVDGLVTRPTTELLRNSIFSVIASSGGLENARVLDLFSGSGALGIEAVSRGAAHATLVDNSAAVLRTCQKNIQKLSVESEFELVQDDALRYVERCTKPYDIVFADPPYTMQVCNKLCHMLLASKVLNDGAWIVCEHGTHEFLLPHDGLETIWRKEQTLTTVQILSYSAQ